MNMKLNNNARKALILSLVLGTLGLAAWLTGLATYVASDARMIDFTQLWLCVLAAVVFSFLFGWARYNLASGAALAVGTAHDLLLTWALTGLIAIVLPQSATLPLVLMTGVACTYVQTLPRLRVARQIYRTTSLRDASVDEMAQQAAVSAPLAQWVALVIAVLFVVAAVVSGNIRMLASLVPIVIALLASLYSARAITPFVWSCVMATRRPARRRA